jgi:hypothetical protein
LAGLCDNKTDSRGLKMSSNKERYKFFGPIYLITQVILKRALVYFNVGIVA